MGDMAEQLDDSQECQKDLIEIREIMSRKHRVRTQPEKIIEAMLQQYQDAKSAKVGTEIICPTCKKKHTKTTYHKIFCSNQKTNGKDNCKDKYWNSVDSKRRERAKEWK